MQTFPLVGKTVGGRIGQTILLLTQMPQKIQLGDWCRQFCCCCGGCRTSICHKVSQRRVRFMAHTGNDRNLRLKYSSYDDFLIKSPKILDGSAASANNQNIQIFSLIGSTDISRYLCGSSFSLNLGRKKQDVHARKTATDCRDDISDDSSTRTGHHPNFLGKLR